MGLVSKLARRFGFVPASYFRAYAAALQNRLTNDWVAGSTSAKDEVSGGLETTRNRARDHERNNDYVRRYLALQVKNVVGPQGIRLQVKAKTPDGKSLDLDANAIIEAGWADWGHPENCSTDGRKSWLDIQCLAWRYIKRDGEALIRRVRGWKDNRYGYALQLLEPDVLDHNKNEAGGADRNRIVMGVELDSWQRPVAYHCFGSNPNDSSAYQVGRNTVRIPANEMLHLFIEEREGQVRGITALSSGMLRLRHLAGYEEAELIAARAAACKMGFIVPGPDYQGDFKADDGSWQEDASPGSFRKLPYGCDVKAWDPNHPNTAYAPFTKGALRGLAAGLDTPYNTLACDLEGVNYSSMRSGEIDSRDSYQMGQAYLIDHLCRVVFRDWLPLALANQALPLFLSDEPRLLADTWQGRRWTWVDPLNDAQANAIAEQQGWKSKMQNASDAGGDLEDVYRDTEAAKKMAAQYGVTEQPAGAPAPAGGVNATEPTT